MDTPNRWPHGYGYCHCGCGAKTPAATRTRPEIGLVRDQPTRYLRGHSPAMRPVPLAQRFWDKVAVRGLDECWIWQAGRRHEYGVVNPGGERRIGAHVAAWLLTHGPIPSGLCVLHRCDVPLCCNPCHLFLGTRVDNNRDRDEKGRRTPPRGERHWKAKITEADVLAIRRRFSAGEPARLLAQEYGLAVETARAIAKRRMWKHLA